MPNVVSFATNHTEMRIAGNSLSEIREFFEKELVGIYDKNEIRALYRQAAQEINGYSMLHLHFHPEDKVQESELLKYSSWVKRLKQNEPVQYITGKSWFMDLEVHVNPAVLIPRPETEEIVNHLLMNLGDRKLRILDACTGSGCIALALKHYLPDSEIMAFDVSEIALAVASSNAQRLGLNIHFQLADLRFSPLDYAYSDVDILISNPPYIPNSEKNFLAKHVAEKEPSIALFVPDEDPLLFYKRLAEWAMIILKNEGKLIAECHSKYTSAVAELWRNSGLVEVAEHNDLSNLPRFVTAVLKK